MNSEKGAFDDLPEDDLDAAINSPKDLARTNATSPSMFEEDCKKCRGSGKFYSWSGRLLGDCRACGGKGKLQFKTSSEHRARAKATSTASKDRKAKENLATFEAKNPTLAAWWTGSDFPFAIAMREAVIKFGDLTEKQFAAAQASANKLAAAKAASAARVDNAKDIDTSNIEAAFAQAATTLKSPKLRLAGMMISRAKATSKNSGALYVKAGETYLGKIMAGKFIRSRDCDDAQEATLLEAATDLMAAAIKYGRLTGSCACCGRELTEKRSVEMGIGPICAAKWGL